MWKGRLYVEFRFSHKGCQKSPAETGRRSDIGGPQMHMHMDYQDG